MMVDDVGSTVGWRNYFMGYRILLHEVPGIAKFSSCEVWNLYTYRELIPLTNSGSDVCATKIIQQYINSGVETPYKEL